LLLSTWRRTSFVFATLVAAISLSAFGITGYIIHIRLMASGLLASAREIRTTSDAEREIQSYKRRFGPHFWTEGDITGGDHTYDAQFTNIPIARFHLVQPAFLQLSIDMRNGELTSVTVIEATGFYPVASVLVQEWFGQDLPYQIHVSGQRPSHAALDISPALPADLRRRVFDIDTGCLSRPRGCNTAEDILPGVWELNSLGRAPQHSD
jgi:hypothetical protein